MVSLQALLISSQVSFQIILAIMAISGNGRSAFMAVFAVVVVVIIKCLNSAVKFKYLSTSLSLWWLCGLLIWQLVQFLLFPML